MEESKFRTYATARSAVTTSTATSTSTSTARWSTLIALLSVLSLTSAGSTLSLLGILLGLAGKLNGNLALQDFLARELGNGALGLAGGREVDKGVANRAVGARVLWDRGRLTARRCQQLVFVNSYQVIKLNGA